MGNFAQQETKQLFLSSRKYLFHSVLAVLVILGTLNTIFIARQHTDARY